MTADLPDLSMFEGDRSYTVTLTYDGTAAGPDEAAANFLEWVAMLTAADVVEFVVDTTPAPPVISDADVERLVTEYVSRVRGNTVPDYDATAAVLEHIDDRMGRWEIVMELGETAHDLGIECPDYDDEPDQLDAWNNRLDDVALPMVAERLRA